MVPLITKRRHYARLPLLLPSTHYDVVVVVLANTTAASLDCRLGGCRCCCYCRVVVIVLPLACTLIRLSSIYISPQTCLARSDQFEPPTCVVMKTSTSILLPPIPVKKKHANLGAGAHREQTANGLLGCRNKHRQANAQSLAPGSTFGSWFLAPVCGQHQQRGQSSLIVLLLQSLRVVFLQKIPSTKQFEHCQH